MHLITVAGRVCTLLDHGHDTERALLCDAVLHHAHRCRRRLHRRARRHRQLLAVPKSDPKVTEIFERPAGTTVLLDVPASAENSGATNSASEEADGGGRRCFLSGTGSDRVDIWWYKAV